MRRGSHCIAATVASSTPAASPRHPACAAASTAPSSLANSTGMQSATWIASTRPLRARDRGVRGAGAVCGISVGDTRAVRLREPAGFARQRQRRAARARRFSRHRRRLIADMQAEIEARKRRCADAPGRERAGGTHRGRCAPFRNQQSRRSSRSSAPRRPAAPPAAPENRPEAAPRRCGAGR